MCLTSALFDLTHLIRGIVLHYQDGVVDSTNSASNDEGRERRGKVRVSKTRSQIGARSNGCQILLAAKFSGSRVVDPAGLCIALDRADRQRHLLVPAPGMLTESCGLNTELHG